MATPVVPVPEDLLLYVGRTFANFQQFEDVLRLRRETLNEVLVKGSGNLSVEKANARLKSSGTLSYRDSFVYAWANFRCTHQGNFKSRGKQRECKSNKLNCPVSLRLVAKKEKDVMEIVSCNMDHNHILPSKEDCHHPHQRKMTEEQKQTITRLSQLGVTYGSLQGHTREVTGVRFKRTDISNAVARSKQAEQGGRTVEEETWKVLATMVQKDENSQFSVAADDGQTVSHIFFQTSSMRNYLKAFPNVVLVDGTYCLNNLGYPLYVFMVIDNDNCGHAVAYAITKNETSSTLKDVVFRFVNMNQCVSNTKTFIVDKDQAEITALKSVMPDTNIILCRFHVSKTFNDCLPKFTKGLPEYARIEAKSLLMKMLYSDSEEEFHEALLQLPDELKNYMQRNWIPCTAFWAQHCTKHILTWGNFTNNCLERHNRKLKTK